jgi:L-ribulose-5-phosphate 3-epimerase
MRKSLSLRMFPPEMDVLSRLDIAREAGFDGVEVNLEPWWEYSLASSGQELHALGRAIQARGLRVSTVYDREQWYYPMTSRDAAVRERCRQIIAGLVRAAAILETDAVLVMPGAVDNRIIAPQPEIVPYAEAYENARDVLSDLARTECKAARVYLVAENCPSKFLISPLEFAHFLDEVDSPWAAACFDTGNALWYGFPEHWIPVLGTRIKRVHVKDNRAAADGMITATPLLAGDVNWPAVRDAFCAAGYDGWMIAEIYPHYRFHPERLIFETSASMDVIFEPCAAQQTAAQQAGG